MRRSAGAEAAAGARAPARRFRRRADLGRGEWTALLAAAALLLFTFFDWYGAEVPGQAGALKLGGGSGAGGDAWQTLGLTPLVLALTVLVVAVAEVMRLAGARWRPEVPLSAVVAVLGGLSAALVLFRLLVPPSLGSLGGIELRATVQLGAFLALAAALGVAYGGYRAMSEAGTSFARIADSLSRPRPDGSAGPRTKRAKRKPPPRFSRSASRRRSRSSSG